MKIFSFLRRSKPRHIFIEVAREFIERSAIEKTLVPDTIKTLENYLSNVTMFLMSKSLLGVELNKMKPVYMQELKYHLHKNLPTCSAAYAARHLEFCKRVLRYAVVMEYIEFSPIDPVKTERGPSKEVVHLEGAELTKIIRRSFASEMYNVVCDLYLFQCFTGLSYADLWSWSIVQDGSLKFITSKRKKTNKTYSAPYTPQVEVILRRYDGSLPKITNQQYNRVLKEVAMLLNINKHLTTHTARKTFATLKNIQGFSLETIADMMGNTPEVARKHYIKGSRERMKQEINRLQPTSIAVII